MLVHHNSKGRSTLIILVKSLLQVAFLVCKHQAALVVSTRSGSFFIFSEL